MAWAKHVRTVVPLVVAFGAAGYLFYWGLSSAASDGVSPEKSTGISAQASVVVKGQKMGAREMQRSTQ